MKKHILCSFTLLCMILSCSIVNVHAQYMPVKKTGTDSIFNLPYGSYNIFRTSPEQMIDNQLTYWRNLPFDFTFYGKKVTGYYASDNGYITFDSTETQSYFNNTDLPAASGPKNAIFAYWDDLRLSPSPKGERDWLYTYTYGEAPYRVHVIHWRSVSTKSTTPGGENFVSFAIRLYECGDFDIVMLDKGNLTGATSGTIGCQNSDASLLTSVAGKEIIFPELTASANDDIVYTFLNSSLKYDLAITNLAFEEVYPINNEIELSGIIENRGYNIVNSFDLLYEVDNSGIIQKESFKSANIQNFSGVFQFAHTKLLKVTGGFHTLKLWVDNINNGNADAVACNSVIERNFIGSTGVQAPKHPMLEEFTGTWCGWCPRGVLVIDELTTKYPDAIVVSIHGPRLTSDTMAIKEGTEIDSTFGFSYPSGNLDRVYANGNKIGENEDKWIENYEKQLASYSPADVQITQQYDSVSRLLNVNANASFVNYPVSGDFRMNVFIVEDSVVNSHPSYDQANYLNTDASSPLYQKGNPIKNYVHKHVLRAVPSTTWGTGNVIPVNPELNKNYSFVYNNIKIDSNWNPSNIKVVAFLSYYNDNFMKRSVLNANQLALTKTKTSGTDEQSSAKTDQRQIRVYPNPARDAVNISLKLDNNENTSITLYNAVGQQVKTISNGMLNAGSHNLIVSINEFPEGLYFINIASEKATSVHKLVITK